jgi:type IV pilus assembly protein PilM
MSMAAHSRLSEFARLQFAPPRYLSLPTAGVDLSINAIKVVTIVEKSHGLELSSYRNIALPAGIISGSEVTDRAALEKILATEVAGHDHRLINAALSESRGYLFEAVAEGTTYTQWRASIEQHIDEHVPLPPPEVIFDIAPLSQESGRMHVVGVGYARRLIDEVVSMYDNAGILIHSLESEVFALPRALLRRGSEETVLIIDIGRMATRLLVVSKRLPRLATTLDIGGHALTLAVQKYFGVTEEEARTVKVEKGLAPGPGNDEYVAAMLSTVSAIKEEVVRRVEYWNSRSTSVVAHEKIGRAIVVGGNANVRGLPEYLETALKIPVELGDVFANFASRADWLPSIDHMDSLGFGTAIGLALREYEQ